MDNYVLFMKKIINYSSLKLEIVSRREENVRIIHHYRYLMTENKKWLRSDGKWKIGIELRTIDRHEIAVIKHCICEKLYELFNPIASLWFPNLLLLVKNFK